MKWTEEQYEAIIHENNENILVSAGAGSGKTAILSERVIRKLKSGVNINELLILTFTKAASEEMKDRIRKKIIDNNLNEQLNLLDSSYITTFDSYALSIVKKYHYLLGLNRNISLVDEAILRIEKSKIIDNILNEYYISKDQDFLFLIKTLVKKDDIALKEGIEEILDKIELEIDTNLYLDNIKNFDVAKQYKIDFNSYYNSITDLQEEISSRLSSMEDMIVEDNDEKFVSKCNEYYSKLVNATSYNEIKNALDDNNRLSLPRKNVNEELNNLKKEITILVNKIKEIAIYENEEFIKRNYILSNKLSSILLNIVEKIYREYTQFKFKNQMFSFIDIAKLAIRIFKENPQVSEEIANSLNEIMIDEYQDTSTMQEIFTNYISRNNLYMVGDIKQSIYRFRYANPNLFKEKYRNYKNHKGGFLIDLNTNFRSRKEVLDNINEIFSSIMKDKIGGADYKKDHLIKYGNLSYLEDNIKEQDNNMLIYGYNMSNYSGLDNSEVEAFIVANDIKNKINEGYLVFDKGITRKAKYKDFTVLLDKRTDFGTYKKIFEYLNLPVNLYQNENIVGHDDLYCFNSILILIKGYFTNIYDNKFIHAYYSLAKSYLFSIKDDEILDTIVYSKYLDSEIYLKLKEIIENLESLSIKDIFRKIIFNLDWYNKLILKADAKSSEARLAYLINLSNNLDKLGYTLDSVIEFFKNINDKGLEISLPNSSNNEADAIKFMTIHNSKGLEFPICYFIGFNNVFNVDEIKDTFIVNKKGIFLPFIEDDTRYPNIKWFDYKKEYILEEVSEKIRLLYVSLTRSKEKMIMVLDLNKDEIKELEDSNCFNDFMLNIRSDLQKYQVEINENDIIFDKEYKKYVPKKNIINDITIFNYKKINIIKEKIVSNKFSKDFKTNDIDENLIKKGVNLHNLLFQLDFKNPDYSNVDTNSKHIINRFLNSKLLNINNALNIYKEYEFIHNEKHGIIDLIVEYENEYKIIDYKLSNIDDDSYVNQLKGYKEYLSNIVNKPISLYLYSLLKGYYKMVD